MALGAIAMILAAAGGAYASNRSSQTMQDAADSELQLMWDQYLQNRSDMQPYSETGDASIYQLSNLLGLPTPQQDSERVFDADAYQRAYAAYNRNQGTPDFGSRSLLYFDPWRHYQEFGSQYGDSASSWGIDLEGAAFGADPDNYQRTFDHQAYQQAYEQYNREQGTPDFSSREFLYESPAEHYQQYGRQFQGAAERRGVDLELAAFGERMTRDELDALQPQPEETQGSAAAEPDLTAFFTSPGYQFNLAEALRANESGAAARGRLNSSATDRSNMRYASNLASNEYLNYMNQLNALSGVGQVTNQNMGNMGMNFAQGAGRAMQNSANARASGYMGNANTFNNLVNSYTAANANNNLASMLYGNSGGGSTYNNTNGYGGQYDDFYANNGNMGS